MHGYSFDESWSHWLADVRVTKPTAGRTHVFSHVAPVHTNVHLLRVRFKATYAFAV